MKAMIFAAGLGTRLHPFTEKQPKALVKVGNTTMLELVIHQLKHAGVTDIIINVHHFADQLIDFIKANNNFDLHIEVSEEREELLDTGGGLKKASWFFSDDKPFILHNVDVLSNVNLNQLLQFHKNNKALVTLAVSERTSSRYFLFDNAMKLSGWENTRTNQEIIVDSKAGNLHRYAFSGIHIIDPSIFGMIQEAGRFSLIDLYLRLAGNNLIQGIAHDAGDWIDMGKPADLEKAALLIRAGRFKGLESLNL
ncbi:MAG: nucleotidyltransferase family protein [Bacteroidales bacterium]|nr:nucleotidyltransferase family protein [Bacteroidales bacterium]